MKSRIFTDYVRSLGASGDPPGAERLAEIVGALRRVLRRELRNRGLWQSPPGYLGIYGARRWDEKEPSDAGEASLHGALGELVAGCYEYIFVQRLRNLLVHLEHKPSIDGLVFLNVRNFLHETQKKHDPLGFRIYEVVHAAVEGTVAAGELHVVAGDSRIRNDTVLSFDAGPPPAAAAERPETPWDEIASRWNDHLLPDLVTAWGKARDRTVAVLQSFLVRLPAEGVDAFRFRDLVDPIKRDARRRWAATFDFEEGETGVEDQGGELGEIVRLVRPDTGVEERESFEKLVDCVTRGLDGLDESARLRKYLRSLWSFLRARAAEPGGELPSRRKIAEMLRIPRNRMSQLYGVLGGVLRSCGEASFAKSAVNSGGGTGHSQGGSAMPRPSTTLRDLGQQTAAARRRHAATEDELRRRAAETVPAEAPCAPLALRCGFALRIAAADFDPARRTGTVPSETLEQARSRRRAAQQGSARSDSENEVDADPEYRGWIAEVVEPAHAAVGERRVVAFRPRRGLRVTLASPWAVAAAIVAALGVGLGGGWQWHRWANPGPADPRQPQANFPFIPLSPDEPSRGGENVLTVPVGAEVIVLILNVVLVEYHDRYQLVIVLREHESAPPRELWRDELARSGPSLPLELPAGWPEGIYELRLSEPAGTGGPLATYTLRIEYDGGDVRNGE